MFGSRLAERYSIGSAMAFEWRVPILVIVRRFCSGGSRYRTPKNHISVPNILRFRVSELSVMPGFRNTPDLG